ncbi:MAG: hypothetical protein LKJ17_00545 [Oscillospiraceae bacterium]|jgi:hypothetical protein|nr:hypothetical protein [Oscillospiraceae bacterium]
MKLIFAKQAKKRIGIVIIVCLIIATFFNVVGYLLGCKYISVAAAVVQADKYEVRNTLLLRAMNQLGACTPQAAIQVWVEGMESRNGAMQYSVMGSGLKKEYLNQVEQYNQYWVTGMSSPQIDSYKIIKTEQKNEHCCVFTLTLFTGMSFGPTGDYNAVLTITKDGDYWRITEISADKGLYPYMGLIG